MNQILECKSCGLLVGNYYNVKCKYCPGCHKTTDGKEVPEVNKSKNGFVK